MVKLYKFKCFDLDHLNPIIFAWFKYYFDIALVQSVGAIATAADSNSDGYLTVVHTILF